MHLIKSILLSGKKKLPNPMLDISIAYLQTNTRLENLEVVERVEIQDKKEMIGKGLKKKDNLGLTQFSTFNCIVKNKKKKHGKAMLT